MRTGRCICGSVAFEFAGEPTDASFCHCSICRQLSGSAFAAWCEVPAENFTWLSGQDNLSRYQLTERLDVHFCRTCGVTMLARHTSWPESRYIPLGPLGDAMEIGPTYHQFTGSKALWYEIHGPLRQFESWPDSAQ